MNQYNKQISLLGGISILAGIMIGSGIFFLGGQILDRVGNSIPLSLLAWTLGGIITLFSALSYAELGTLFPENGGYYVYLKEAYGKKTAFLSGYMNLALSSSGSIAVLAILFSDILNSMFETTTLSYMAIVAVILLTIFNYFGIKIGTWIQMIFMVAKLIPIVMIIVMGLIVGNQTLDLTSNTFSGQSIFQILIALGYGIVGTLWAYEGWTNLNVVAGEMKDAKKDLPKALSTSVIGVMVIYVIFILSLYRLVAYNDLLEAYNGWFIFNAAYALFGEIGQMIIMISVLVSVFGALNGSILVFPRVYQKMANDGLFFKTFDALHPTYKTPYKTLILSSFIAIVLILLPFDVNDLLTYVVFTGLIFNALIFYSVFLFRKRKPMNEYPRSYQVWGYPWVPSIAIVGMGLLLIATIIENPINSLIGFVVLLVGFIIIKK
jgi:basic amino acid/polyamine antiporter, APA family